MLNSIIRFSIRNKFIVMLFVLALIVFGSFSLTKLPIDAVPDITNNQVQIITVSSGLGATDVERFISMPIEIATRNVPGIIDQRSFSRFGLSIVTLVFNDETDIYWARQQVSERLVDVKDQIPKGMGSPFMAPVTTGLGEIYQYVVKPKKGYEGKYSLTDLRTIQDWIVRKQLLGTEGVADVSSFGGNLKQYEIAIVPEKLKSLNVTIDDVFSAVAKNNQNAGGAYVEKGASVLFIRTEGLLNNMEQIENTVVKQLASGVPVLLKDVASVKIGSAIRYGAMTYNDKGEVAGAVVMMLKGANSNVVIKNVKLKIQEIQKSLPEGIEIKAFLDRTKMVNNAISTVEKNLLEGALIVVFVLVLFLGNMRAGLIVASVIPLAMLFAIIMMNLMGVSGNLMSLGALDFGLLVDGAVIIVEAVMHRLKHTTIMGSALKFTQQQMDDEVEDSSKKMMNSAAFGQIIILIVYLPILSLSGIEGKMFRPMAETVSFAVIGAFILSLTYVPMMTALFMSKKVSTKDNFADKAMYKIQKLYQPLLHRAMKIPRTIIAVSVVVFAFAVWLLGTLGGEFIPQLEEGDFAVETRMLTGSSLENMATNIQKASSILRKEFPEVKMVVGKIGSSEIPTDPMPMDAADMMVILKDKKEWTSAKTFPELAEKMSAKLKDIPGMQVGFQFPVQMRFNELMTGARQDVVCKIFGDNLDSLAFHADKLGQIINTIEGAKDLYIETVTGVQQLVVKHNRSALAMYGVSVEDVNNAIATAYSGSVAGQVFEGEKRFDLVLRMQDDARKNISDMRDIPVTAANGQQVPLGVLSEIKLEDGPYQIQRQDAARRIVVGFNVRGRDVESIVKELQEKVAAKVKLPAGYNLTYGGQYENLQNATKRLSIALPIALGLIFLMLFFAFKKIKYCLIIFTAIPLSAIGGVFALWSRGMSFSISAGVGFIALFGVAVLNGIVLITEMNRMKEEHPDSDDNMLKKIIYASTKSRLRPVLMTAAVASLGFLPMAITTGAGGEVQRPLATVVIGGLVSATFLTLFVLPAIYFLVERWSIKRRLKLSKVATVLALVLVTATAASAQTIITLPQALEMAERSHLQIRSSQANVKYQELLRGTERQIPGTEVIVEGGQINSANFDNKISLVQNITLPVVYKKERLYIDEKVKEAMLQNKLDKALVKKQVKTAYLSMQYTLAKAALLDSLVFLISDNSRIARLRFEKGETNLLEKTTVETQVATLKMQHQQAKLDNMRWQQQMAVLLQNSATYQAGEALQAWRTGDLGNAVAQHPYLQLVAQQKSIAQAQVGIEQSKLLPAFTLGVNSQTFKGWTSDANNNPLFVNGSKRFTSGQIGVLLPLFNGAQKQKIRAAKQFLAIADYNSALAEQQLLTEYNMWKTVLGKAEQQINYYESTAINQANVIVKNASDNYKNGSINFLEWSMLINNAINIKSGYLDAIKEYNEAVIELGYLTQNPLQD